MDEFYGLGSKEEAKPFLDELSQYLELKVQIHTVGGPSLTHLKRERTLKASSIRIAPNSKYLKGVLQQLGIENGKPVATPSTLSKQEESDDSELLDAHGATFYRSMVGSLAYFALGRQDVQCEVSHLAT